MKLKNAYNYRKNKNKINYGISSVCVFIMFRDRKGLF